MRRAAPVDFSSAKAWRNIESIAKYAAGLIGVAAVLVMAINALQGGPLLSRAAIIGVPLLYLLALTLAFLWWAFLRLSEMTLGRGAKAPTNSGKGG